MKKNNREITHIYIGYSKNFKVEKYTLYFTNKEGSKYNTLLSINEDSLEELKKKINSKKRKIEKLRIEKTIKFKNGYSISIDGNLINKAGIVGKIDKKESEEIQKIVNNLLSIKNIKKQNDEFLDIEASC